jgi:hypothetical protein
MEIAEVAVGARQCADEGLVRPSEVDEKEGEVRREAGAASSIKSPLLLGVWCHCPLGLLNYQDNALHSSLSASRSSLHTLATMKLSFALVLSALSLGLAAPADNSDSTGQLVKRYFCQSGTNCASLCAAGSQSINCGDSYVRIFRPLMSCRDRLGF